jgi:hypothetical protein
MGIHARHYSGSSRRSEWPQSCWKKARKGLRNGMC